MPTRPNQGKRKRGRKGGRQRNPKRAPLKVIDHLEARHLLPCLYFSFSRKECEFRARDNSYRNLLEPSEASAVLADYDKLVQQYGMTASTEAAHFRNGPQVYEGQLSPWKDGQF